MNLSDFIEVNNRWMEIDECVIWPWSCSPKTSDWSDLIGAHLLLPKFQRSSTVSSPPEMTRRRSARLVTCLESPTSASPPIGATKHRYRLLRASSTDIAWSDSTQPAMTRNYTTSQLSSSARPSASSQGAGGPSSVSATSKSLWVYVSKPLHVTLEAMSLLTVCTQSQSHGRRLSASPSPDGALAIYTPHKYSRSSRMHSAEVRVLDLKTGNSTPFSKDPNDRSLAGWGKAIRLLAEGCGIWRNRAVDIRCGRIGSQVHITTGDFVE